MAAPGQAAAPVPGEHALAPNQPPRAGEPAGDSGASEPSGSGSRSAKARRTCSSRSAPSWPSRSATVSATRRTRSSPLADRRPSRSLRSRSRLAPALNGAIRARRQPGTSALQRTPRTSSARRRASCHSGGYDGRGLVGAGGRRRRGSPSSVPRSASTSGRRTLMRRSNRSRRGPETRAA